MTVTLTAREQPHGLWYDHQKFSVVNSAIVNVLAVS